MIAREESQGDRKKLWNKYTRPEAQKMLRTTGGGANKELLESHAKMRHKINAQQETLELKKENVPSGEIQAHLRSNCGANRGVPIANDAKSQRTSERRGTKNNGSYHND